LKNKNNVKKTILFISLIYIFASCSQEAEESKHQDVNSIEESEIISSSPSQLVETSLESQALTDEQVSAFEKRALEKVEDLVDYLNIISDEKYDKGLRENTLNLSLELFDSNMHTIQNAQLSNKSRTITVHQYLEEIYKGTLRFAQLKSVKVTQNTRFKLQSDNRYTSSISVTENEFLFNVELILKKNLKEIGENEFDIWEVKLGNIY
jgi:hypothetical protein